MAPDVRLELTHGPEGPGVLADGRALTVPPHSSATDVGLAAARRHAARSGRDLLIEVVDGGSVTTVSVGPQGFVTLVSAPPRPTAPPHQVPVPAPASFATEWVGRTEAPVAPPAPDVPSPRTGTTPPAGPLSPWARPAPAAATGRPVASLVVTALVAVAVLVGAVGTGVATLASSQALPGSCRPVTVYAVGGAGGASDVLRGVTDPLSAQFGEKISVVTVPPPPTGGSYASAESDAVSSLANSVGEHVEGCPTGALMLFGYSQGAQVAGDLASRVGTGLEPRIPANLIQAVGLFGDPARSPRTRAVPEGTEGQGALPPRAVGFGSLDARTIEICAPGDPVCDSPPSAATPALEQALASPVHGSYQQLPVAAGTTAPQWAAASLGKVVAAIPTDAGPAKADAGTSAQSGAVATTTPGAAGSTASGSGPADSSGSGTGSTTSGSGDVGAATATPEYGDESGGAGSTAGSTVGPTVTAAPGASATGDGDGAGAATRRSGSAGPSGAADPSGSAPGTSGTGSSGTVTDGQGSAVTGSAGAGSTGTGSSGTVSNGQGSAGTTGTSTGSTGTGSTGTSGTGTGTGSRSTGTGSAGTGSSGTVSNGQGSAGAGSAGAGSTGTGSSGTVSNGQGSAGTGSPGTESGPAVTRAPSTSAGASGSGEYGSSNSTSSTGAASLTSTAPADSGSGSATGSGSGSAQSTTPSTTPSASGNSTTTSSASPRDGGSGGSASSGGGVTGAVTGAAFSLKDGLDGFKSTPWNNQNATDPSTAPSPNVPGREAVKFEMPGGGKRTEAEPDVPEFQDGQKAFVGYSGFFDKGFPTNTDTWQLIMQFKQPGTGSPPLAVEVGKGQLRLANNGGNEKDFCPVTEGAFSFQLGVMFGGAIDAWCNGKQTLTGYTTPQSNVKGSAYLKTGIYRDESIKQDSTLFVNDLKVGKSLEQVSGLAGVEGGSGSATATDAAAGGTSSTTSASDGASASGASGAGAAAAPTSTAPSSSAGTASRSGTAAEPASASTEAGSTEYGSTGMGAAATARSDPSATTSATSADAAPATASADASPPTARAGTGTGTGTGTSTGTGPATGGQTSGGQSTGGQKVCDKFGSTDVDDGRFMVQNNEWGASDDQCVTATTQGFTVNSGDHAKNDAPAAYPSIMSGCWMGTCTQGTTLPTRISDLGPISSSIAGAIPAGTKSNLAYDVWADSTAKKNGHNDAMELMIWLKETGGIKPIGQQAGTATIGGATWDVWKGTNGGVNVISYVRQGYVDQANDLPITDFVKDAVAQGSVQATDFLTNIQAGFEPWTGGPGMALSRFDVTYGGGAVAPVAR